MPEKPTRQSAKNERRQAILDSAAELFAARGFGAVSMEEIGNAAGITGPGLYRHFKNKRQLLAEILGAASRQLDEGAKLISSKSGDATETLRSLIDFHLTFSTSSTNTIRLQDRDLLHLTEEQQANIRGLQRSYIETWIKTLAATTGETDRTELRLRVQATFGLLNSTPHSADEATRKKAETAKTLAEMSFAALTV